MVTYILLIIMSIALIVMIGLYSKQAKYIHTLENRVKKTEEIKSSFLTHITQALRTPVTIINEYCHTIETKGCEKLTDAERKEVLGNIQKNNMQMLSYLNELQELTSFDGSVPTISMIEVNLAELIISYRREILHEIRRGVTVSIQTDMSPHCKATLNTTLFRQLIMHLLRLGAIRTKEGTITIEYAIEKGGLRFNLSDTGDAVSQELMDILFTNSVADEHITHLDQRSTIISLNICKSIIDSMEGTIEARPGVNGKGITVSFWFPCSINTSK